MKSDHQKIDSSAASTVTPDKPKTSFGLRAAEAITLAGFVLYAIFAPHSIAGAEIALGLVAVGWLLRLLLTRRHAVRRTPLDIPIALFLTWTFVSSVLSAEPRISMPKLQSILVVLLFYLTQSILTRRTAVLIVALMILSAVAGVGESAVDLVQGRGVMIEEMSTDSPFHEFQLGKGDAVWRVAGVRVLSVGEIDEAIRRSTTGARVPVSIIMKGEHGERAGLIITDDLKSRASPSGITSSGPTHRFRASGWTRHYETFSETLQILAQLALGIGLANLTRRGSRWVIRLALTATAILAVGIAMTAMRTILVAFAIGAAVIVVRATRGRTRIAVSAAIVAVLVIGAFAVWRARPSRALLFDDYSSSLRWNVAQVGVSRLMLHPVFGHGMDAVKGHWTEWGFPGADMIHMHSTPLQIAFDRGLPALVFWLWIMVAAWLIAARGEKIFREFTDANRHGLLLGATGAIAGFFASSLVNYNFGDAEVALVFWWLMGTVVVVSAKQE